MGCIAKTSLIHTIQSKNGGYSARPPGTLVVRMNRRRTFHASVERRICPPGAAGRAALPAGEGLPVGFLRRGRHLRGGAGAAAGLPCRRGGRRDRRRPDQLHPHRAVGPCHRLWLVPEAGRPGGGGHPCAHHRLCQRGGQRRHRVFSPKGGWPAPGPRCSPSRGRSSSTAPWPRRSTAWRCGWRASYRGYARRAENIAKTGGWDAIFSPCMAHWKGGAVPWPCGMATH